MLAPTSAHAQSGRRSTAGPLRSAHSATTAHVMACARTHRPSKASARAPAQMCRMRRRLPNQRRELLRNVEFAGPEVPMCPHKDSQPPAQRRNTGARAGEHVGESPRSNDPSRRYRSHRAHRNDSDRRQTAATPRDSKSHDKPHHCDSTRRDETTGRWEPNEPPRLVVAIRTVDGDDAQRLAAEQARVIREVMEWQLQNRSARGRDNAA